MALIFLFKDKIFLHSHLQCQLCLLDCNMTFYKKMENSLPTLHLDRLFSQWNNTIYRMNYWVHTAGGYRATAVIGSVHATFFTSHQIQEMIYMLDEIILARMMTAMYLEFLEGYALSQCRI